MSVSFIVQAASVIGGSCHKYHFCRDKIMFVATSILLSRQTRVCRDKSKLVATNVIVWRQKFCGSKHTFVPTKDVFCRDKHG